MRNQACTHTILSGECTDTDHDVPFEDLVTCSRRWLNMALWLWALVLVPLSALSQPLPDEPVFRFDTGQLSALRDPSGRFGLEDARAAFVRKEFRALPGNLAAGYVPHAYWLHLSFERLPSQAAARWLEVMPPYLDSIQLFHINPQGLVDQRQGGDLVPQSAKEESYRGTAFKLNLEPGRHDIYLRLKTTSTVVAVVSLWQPQAFETHLRYNYLGFGLYFSLILTVLVFNAVNWLVSRRTIFAVYTGYLLFNGLQWLGISGFVSEFIFPQTPLLANVTLGLSLSLSSAMTFVFISMVFELKKYHPWIRRVYQGGVVMALVTAVATPFGYYQSFLPWVFWIAVVSIGVAFWPLRRLWRTQHLWARLLVFAYLVYAALLMFNVFGTLAVIPFSQTNTYVGMGSNIVHILVLHFTILLHYRRIEADHTQALAKAALTDHKLELESTHREEQSQLLAMISHEIRTPIAVIDAASESLRLLDGTAPGTDDDRKRRYDRIRQAVMRMKMVMELSVVQAEDERLPFELRLFDLTWLTYDIIELSGDEALSRVAFDSPEEDVTVQADLQLVRVALLNLLGNALKYSPADSPIRIRVQNADTAQGRGVQWVIEDQGPGIAVGTEQTVFNKFHRGQQAEKMPGMGLGLFLVASIAARHSGRVKAENMTPHGARFSFWLPRSATSLSKVS